MNFMVDLLAVQSMVGAMNVALEQLEEDRDQEFWAFTNFLHSYINSDKAALEQQFVDYHNQSEQVVAMAAQLRNCFSSLVGAYENLSQIFLGAAGRFPPVASSPARLVGTAEPARRGTD